MKTKNSRMENVLNTKQSRLGADFNLTILVDGGGGGQAE